MTKAEIEMANWYLAHNWHEHIGLDFAGVSLGDAATYSFLSVIGRIQLSTAEQAQTEQVTNAE